jgi:hypothetical protein
MSSRFGVPGKMRDSVRSPIYLRQPRAVVGFPKVISASHPEDVRRSI